MNSLATSRRIMVKQLSEALLNHYCVILSRRNRLPIQCSDQIRQVEDVGSSILIDIHKTNLSSKRLSKLYTSIKTEMSGQDIGYQYIAEKTTKMLHTGALISSKIKKTDTSKFWQQIDSYFV